MKVQKLSVKLATNIKTFEINDVINMKKLTVYLATIIETMFANYKIAQACSEASDQLDFFAFCCLALQTDTPLREDFQVKTG